MKKVGLCLIIAAAMSSSGWADAQLIEISAKKFLYTPNIVRINRGDEITIRLTSEDVTHGFFLDGYGVETHAGPGEAGSVTFIADRTGRFNFRCSVTCGEFHPFMVGYLVVRPNIRFFLFVIIIVAVGVGSVVAILLNRKKV